MDPTHRPSRVMRVVADFSGKLLSRAINTSHEASLVVQKLTEEQFVRNDLPDGFTERFSAAAFFRLKNLFVSIAKYYYDIGYTDGKLGNPKGLNNDNNDEHE